MSSLFEVAKIMVLVGNSMEIFPSNLYQVWWWTFQFANASKAIPMCCCPSPKSDSSRTQPSILEHDLLQIYLSLALKRAFFTTICASNLTEMKLVVLPKLREYYDLSASLNLTPKQDLAMKTRPISNQRGLGDKLTSIMASLGRKFLPSSTNTI